MTGEIGRGRVALALLLGGALLVAPGDINSAFAGPPLGAAARWGLLACVVLGIFVTLARPTRRVPAIGLAIVAGLIGLQVAVGASVPAQGWRGVYEMRDEPPAVARFAARFAVNHFRLDRRLDFDGDGFGLHFVNDFGRYGRIVGPERRDVWLPLRVTWTSSVELEQPAAIAATVRGRGAVSLLVNGRPALVASGDTFEATTTIDRPAGRSEFNVVYTKESGISPAFALRLVGPDGELRVSPTWAAAQHMRQLPSLPRAAPIVAMGWLVILGLGVHAYWPARPALLRLQWRQAVAGTSVLAVAAVILHQGGGESIPWRHGTFPQGAGDDPIAYVGNARSVLLEGWLMPQGAPLGAGRPFYFYPFFSYALGTMQWFIGDDFTVVRLLNFVSLALLAPLIYRLVHHDLQWWAIILLQVGVLVMVLRHFWPYGLTGLTDTLFVGVVFATLLWCRRALVGPWWHALVAGVGCAIAAATRPSFLTFTPLFLIALVIWRDTVPLPVAWRRAGLVAVGYAAGLLPFALRNQIVSGQFVVLVNSWIQVPYFLIDPAVKPNPVQDLLPGIPSLVACLRLAWQIILDDPLRVLLLEVRKVGFTLGATHWGLSSRLYPEFLLLSVAFAILLLRRRAPLELRRVGVVFAVSHLAAMVLAAPWTYGYKSILPLQLMFLVFAAYLLPGALRADGFDLELAPAPHRQTYRRWRAAADRL